jgi:hypothetical protein
VFHAAEQKTGRRRTRPLEGSRIAPASSLHPLGIGEMLDRAVTISVRFFVLLASIYVVFMIPLTFFQYFGTADLAKFFANVTDAIQKSGQRGDQQGVLNALTLPPVFNVFTVLYFAFALLVAPLAGAALMWAVANIYAEGRVPTFREAYREGLRCWLPLIGVNLLWGVSAMIAYVAAVLLILIVIFGFVLLNVVLKGFAIALGVVAGLVLFVAFFVLVLVGVLAANVSYFAIVVERAGFITAFASGLTRVFRRSLRRSALVALTLFAVDIGIYLMGLLGQGVLLGVLRNNALGTAFGALLSLITVLFTTVFGAIYYYDILVRTEGLDLRVATASQVEAVNVAAP